MQQFVFITYCKILKENCILLSDYFLEYEMAVKLSELRDIILKFGNYSNILINFDYSTICDFDSLMFKMIQLFRFIVTCSLQYVHSILY